MKEFLQKFKFGNKDFNIGVERESFITDDRGNILPLAQYILKKLPQNGRFGYELSACQLEDRARGENIAEVISNLNSNNNVIENIGNQLHFKMQYIEVAPHDMPIVIYPDKRYEQITKKMTYQVLLAACRIAGTHIHIKMNSAKEAMKVYNGVIKHTNELIEMGNSSKGKRMQLYSVVEPHWKPLVYKNWVDFMSKAIKLNFYCNPRNCWHIIRISAQGSIEFRTFGVTPSILKIAEWIKYCQDLCNQYR